jgi:hypothetical protein
LARVLVQTREGTDSPRCLLLGDGVDIAHRFFVRQGSVDETRRSRAAALPICRVPADPDCVPGDKQ